MKLLLFCTLLAIVALALASKPLTQQDVDETVKHVIRNIENMKYCTGDDTINCIQRNLDNIFMYPGGGIALLGMVVIFFVMICVCFQC